MRIKTLILLFSVALMAMNISCTRTFTCEDGLQNQGETGIDCGGPCINCGLVASCFDGTQNQDETGIDCGGVCPDCAGTCSDGVMNQNETGIDCGGVCAPCSGTDPTCTDGIQNGDETGVDCGGTMCSPCAFGCGNPDTSDDIFTASAGGGPFSGEIMIVSTIGGNLSITGTALDGNVISLTHNGALSPGTYALGAGAFATSGGQSWSTVNGGTGEITIDTYDTASCTMDGSFFFDADDNTGSNLEISNGIFENLDF